MNQPPLYSLRNLQRRFGERLVLDIPELQLDKGKTYGLLGPNGSGKTTLLRLLAFMDSPTQGVISFLGNPTNNKQASRFHARVVWVPQTPIMFSGTLLYNVEYPMRLKGQKASICREKALALLRDVGLEHLADSPARRLSGGEAQRGSIARALAAGPEVILFDEPTGGVDHRSRAEITQLIASLHKVRGLSIFIATHDLGLPEALCEEIIMLEDGKVTNG